MIHFFARQRDTLEKFIESWAPELAGKVRIHSHHRLLFLRNPESGAYIFADFERLRPWKFSRLKRLAERLRAEPKRFSMLNDPDRYVSRFDFMRALRARGVNEFQVYRIDELDANIRFPVFLRSEVDHRGAIGTLLYSRDAVHRALRWLGPRNVFRRRQLMLVEYCDCADANGVFRKYSAMKVGERLIPRHVLFSRDWVTKKPDLVSDETVAEEARFVEEFPHREELAKVFEIAGVDYGRVDYGIQEGQVQVWEINTNPVVVPQRGIIDPRRLPVQSLSARAIVEALVEWGGNEKAEG